NYTSFIFEAIWMSRNDLIFNRIHPNIDQSVFMYKKMGGMVCEITQVVVWVGRQTSSARGSEILGAEMAIQFAMQQDWASVIIEGDAEQVTKVLNKESEPAD
ncbi:hypothetical protein IFM89_009563, partial [Coptis chinensis]